MRNMWRWRLLPSALLSFSLFMNGVRRDESQLNNRSSCSTGGQWSVLEECLIGHHLLPRRPVAVGTAQWEGLTTDTGEFQGIRYLTEGGTPAGVDTTAQLTQARGTCGHLVVRQEDLDANATLEVRATNTCSKASLLLSFGQMAVGAKVGMSGGGWVGGFRPSFPLDEVGNPALSQGCGLCHVVSDCLRNTCDRQRRETSEN